jgi:CheY-like chemotaxis protein
MDFLSDSVQKRILVVDDNVDAANLTAELLNILGFSAQAVHDGHRAVELARHSLPNIVIADLGMPYMDGFQVARALRELPGASSLRIVALTGWNDRSTRARVIECGFDDHLTKPATIDALLATIGHST